MDMQTATDRINAAADLGATIKRGEIHVTKYGRPAGVVTQDDLDSLGHTPTGWGKSLRKGALEVWRALAEG
jgi:hypothetical protein